jgi:hypothetical protein
MRMMFAVSAGVALLTAAGAGWAGPKDKGSKDKEPASFNKTLWVGRISAGSVRAALHQTWPANTALCQLAPGPACFPRSGGRHSLSTTAALDRALANPGSASLRGP